jgi:hypothetical protein
MKTGMETVYMETGITGPLGSKKVKVQPTSKCAVRNRPSPNFCNGVL